MSKYTLALDIGSSSSTIAVAKNDGSVRVVESINGERTSPAYICFDTEETMCGLPAKQNIIRNSVNTIVCAKRLVGKKFSDIDAAERRKWECNIIDVEGLPMFEIEVNGETKTYSPSDIIGFLIADLKNAAEVFCGCTLEEVVLTYPAAWEADPNNKIVLENACKKAGLKVMRLISEEAAAIMGSDYVSDFQDANVIVYNIGAYSTTATLMAINGGMFRVEDTVADYVNGAQMLSVKLMQLFAGIFAQKTKLNVTQSKRAVHKLRLECERVMQVLSTSERTAATIESLMEGLDLHTQVERTRFEQICKDSFNVLLKPLDTLLNNNDDIEIDRVILTGGGCKIPAILELINERFADKKNTTIDNTITSDEITALGAAKQAALLSQFEDNQGSLQYVKLDAVAKTISIVNAEGKCVPVFRKNLPLPARKHIPFTSANGEDVLLEVYEGDSENPSENTLVKQVPVKGLPAGTSTPLSVSLYINHNGSFRTTVMGTKDAQYYADCTVEHA